MSAPLCLICGETIQAHHHGGMGAMFTCANPAADEIQSLRQRVGMLEGALRGIVDHFGKCDDGNAPGHGHSIPGIWDSDNHPAIAGKPCEWCAHWNEARAALSPKVQEGE